MLLQQPLTTVSTEREREPDHVLCDHYGWASPEQSTAGHTAIAGGHHCEWMCTLFKKKVGYYIYIQLIQAQTK